MAKVRSVFSTNVRVLRKKHGWTQAELAEACGISEGAIREIESGRRSGSLPTLKSLAKAFDTTAEDLLSDPNAPINTIKLTQLTADDLSLDYELLTKIASLGPNEMSALKIVVEGMYQAAKNKKIEETGS